MRLDALGYYHRAMAQDELLALARRIHALMAKLTDEEERYYDEIATELGGEDEIQMALLATAIVEGLIEPTAALIPILQEIEEKLLELVEA